MKFVKDFSLRTTTLGLKLHLCDVMRKVREMGTVSAIIIHVLMRDEKGGRKKQARSDKQQGKATQHTQGSHFS